LKEKMEENQCGGEANHGNCLFPYIEDLRFRRRPPEARFRRVEHAMTILSRHDFIVASTTGAASCCEHAQQTQFLSCLPAAGTPAAFAIQGIGTPRWPLSNLKRLYQETRFVPIMSIQSACVQRSAKVASGSDHERQERSTVAQTSLLMLKAYSLSAAAIAGARQHARKGTSARSR
jgi:hypothetical protein